MPRQQQNGAPARLYSMHRVHNVGPQQNVAAFAVAAGQQQLQTSCWDFACLLLFAVGSTLASCVYRLGGTRCADTAAAVVLEGQLAPRLKS